MHRRLRPDEIAELVKAYKAGTTVYELSRQFRIHRVSVSSVLERESVPRRYRVIDGDQLKEAIRDYQGGRSVMSIANELGVAGDTVRRALGRAGVKLRPRLGWKY